MMQSQFLEPIEQLVAAVIERHPEYHDVLDEPERALTEEYDPRSLSGNPFLHMSLHVALHEQLQTDRPPGVLQAYRAIEATKKLEAHAIEHAMMTCLAASLWEAQREARMPDEQTYLERLRQYYE